MFIISPKKTIIKRLLFSLAIAFAIIFGIEKFSNIQFPNQSADLPSLRVLFVLFTTFIIFLLFAIRRRVAEMLSNNENGKIGFKLQARILSVFSLIVVIPVLIMAVLTTMFFIQGLKGWFDSSISKAIHNSTQVAEAYLVEHSSNLQADAYAMSRDISRYAIQLMKDKEDFQEFLTAQAAWRILSDAIVFRKKDVENIIASSKDTIPYLINYDEIKAAIEIADKGQIALINTDHDKVKALIKLKSFKDTYLFISRLVDPKVLEHISQTKNSAKQYSQIKDNAFRIQVTYSVLYGFIALTLLLSAMWVGLVFAKRIIAPVHNLIKATERVRHGDLTVRVTEGEKDDEITNLLRAFNSMTGNLQQKQIQLTAVNEQIEKRRRLIEAVFSGVNSGIVYLDEKKRVKLINESAIHILQIENETRVGRFVADIFPEIALVFSQVKNQEDQIFQQQIDIKRDGVISNLLIRIVTEKSHLGHTEGYIITIDDITKLVNAQRQSAWSDVARRIAHEIKNPLTPITLSAERIRKKYAEVTAFDAENFNRYVDTIIRHSENIEKIVREFSDFARLPQPILIQNNLSESINAAIFSEKVVNTNIEYFVNLPKEDVIFDFDKEQISRVFTNLLKNAGESLNEKGTSSEILKPQISVILKRDKNVQLQISDNGKGFPPEMLNRLTEPYVTTREKGTGLGLAIVKKILDDHNASFHLYNKIDDNGVITGACIDITFQV